MDFDPDAIREIRRGRGQTQVEFGREIYDADDAHKLQVTVSRLEIGKQRPGSAARRTLRRMVKGEI